MKIRINRNGDGVPVFAVVLLLIGGLVLFGGFAALHWGAGMPASEAALWMLLCAAIGSLGGVCR